VVEVGGPGTGGPTASTTTVSEGAGQSNPEGLEQLDNYATAHYPDSYGGLAVAGDGRVDVYRRPDRALEADLSSRFRALNLRFVDAKHSRRALRALADRIRQDIPDWRREGIQVLELSAPPGASRVKVGTANPDRDRRVLVGRYGALIEVVEGHETPY
jgi:hypothetical protein